MSMKPLRPIGPSLGAPGSRSIELVAILLALLLPPVGIFCARHALDTAQRQGTDETTGRFALWISIAFTAAGLLVFVVGFLTSVVIPLLSNG